MICLCLISDDNYAMYTGIALTSLKINKKPSNDYLVYILSDGISVENRNRLSALHDDRFRIEIVEVSEFDSIKKDMYIDHIPATPTALYKFRIMDILSENKVLYVDGDVLFYKDVEEIFDYDLKDSYAAVIPELIGNNEVPLHCSRIGKDCCVYFNSGLMLLNLDKCRREGISDRLIDYRKNGINYFMDQDAFNVVFGNEVVYFPTYYFTLYSELLDKKNYSKYGSSCRQEIINKTIIMHLYTKNKPWVKKQKFITKQYLHYHKQSPFSDIEIRPNSYTNQVYNILYDKLENTWLHKIIRGMKNIVKK